MNTFQEMEVVAEGWSHGCRVLALGALAIALPAMAQQPDSAYAFSRDEITAGSTAERALIDLAHGANVPIAERPFGPLEIDRLLAIARDTVSRRVLRPAPAWSTAWINTTRAYNENDGPVWAGRGLTIATSAGASGRWWIASYSFRPVAFWTQNLSYNPSLGVRRRANSYADPWLGSTMDMPYRYGPSSYGRVDVGESFLRVDSKWIAAGVSNAAQVWGPARSHPLVLGNTSGGFPHVFVETGTPRPIGIGTVAMRWIAGRLVGSPFLPVNAKGTRIGIGAVGSFLPRGFNGLELGGARFYHLYDSPFARDWQSLMLPFSELFKAGIPNADVRGPRQSNQVASAFFRLAPPGAPAELYGEFYRDDHSYNIRDLFGEPDHTSGYLVGFQRYWLEGEGVRRTVMIEAVNGRISHLERVRSQGISYANSFVTEGHTLRGVPLGSPILPGGGALTVVFEWRRGASAWSAIAEVARRAQDEEGGSWKGTMTGYYTLGARREFRRHDVDWTSEVRLQPGYGDVPGTNVALMLRATRSRLSGRSATTHAHVGGSSRAR